jgi:hypothetical protein
MFYGNTQDYYRHTACYRLTFRMGGHPRFHKMDMLTPLLPWLSRIKFWRVISAFLTISLGHYLVWRRLSLVADREPFRPPVACFCRKLPSPASVYPQDYRPKRPLSRATLPLNGGKTPLLSLAASPSGQILPPPSLQSIQKNPMVIFGRHD